MSTDLNDNPTRRVFNALANVAQNESTGDLNLSFETFSQDELEFVALLDECKDRIGPSLRKVCDKLGLRGAVKVIIKWVIREKTAEAVLIGLIFLLVLLAVVGTSNAEMIACIRAFLGNTAPVVLGVGGWFTIFGIIVTVGYLVYKYDVIGKLTNLVKPLIGIS
jgi:hypothetical protein